MSSKTKTTGTKKNEKPAIVPKRRFPEFQNEEGWKLVTLEKASVPVNERVGQRKLTPVSISAGIGFVPQSEKFGRDISGNQYQLYTLVSDGDFVFNKGNSLKFPQGCVYLLQGWGQVAAPNVFICFRLKDGYSNGFFQNCFEQNQHGKQLKKHITSGARSNGLLNISKDSFFGVEIPIPSLPEQQKIAECLSSVDELIAAQARKVDALKTHKKGLMQQLFPRDVETQPRLRFPEFRRAERWKSITLKEISTPITERVGQRKLTPVSISAGIGFVPQVEKFGRDISGNQYQLYTLVSDGDFVYNKGNSLKFPQGCVYLLQGWGQVAAPNVFICFRLQDGCVNGFFQYCFELNMHGKQLRKHITSGARSNGLLNINKENFFGVQIPTPSPAEQQKITDCLTSLDDLIAAETQKLEALKTHKKGLMQQLFPAPAEVNA